MTALLCSHGYGLRRFKYNISQANTTTTNIRNVTSVMLKIATN